LGIFESRVRTLGPWCRECGNSVSNLGEPISRGHGLDAAGGIVALGSYDFVILWGPVLKPPALRCSKNRALELRISILFLGGVIPGGTPPLTPHLFRANSGAVNSRIGIDLTFTGPKVVRIVWEDHVIGKFFFFFRSPRLLVSLMCRGEFITLCFDLSCCDLPLCS
jgi:hypothetical protein